MLLIIVLVAVVSLCSVYENNVGVTMSVVKQAAKGRCSKYFMMSN